MTDGRRPSPAAGRNRGHAPAAPDRIQRDADPGKPPTTSKASPAMSHDTADDHEREFPPALLEQIARHVAQGIAALRDPSVKPPSAADYWNGDVIADDEPRSLLVDVAVGQTTLTIHAASDHFETAPLDDGAGLAALIVARAAEFARDHALHSRRFRQLRALVAEGLARAQTGMKLLDVGVAAVPAERSIAGGAVDVTARIEMLDATLRPYRRWVAGSDPSEAAAEIGDLAPGQRRRARARARLDAVGAALEVDAVAERAIAAAGLSMGAIARDLTSLHRRDDCDGPLPIPASGGAIGVMLAIEDGCIIAQLEVPGIVITRGERLQLYQALPESVALAVEGRQATDVVDLPALRGLATITKATVVAERQRSYFELKIPRRPIPRSEMDA